MSNTEVADSQSETESLVGDALKVTRQLSGKVLVDGEIRFAQTSEQFDVIHPGNLSKIGHAPRCGAEDVNAAVGAAKNAFKDWRKVPARERGRMLQKAADAMEAEAGRGTRGALADGRSASAGPLRQGRARGSAVARPGRP